MTQIPFLDLGRLHSTMREELDEAFASTVAGSSFVGSGTVAPFEEEFAGAHGVAHGVGCGSGTDALSLAIRALQIGPGDEVIVPAMTFVATATAVIHAGATPVMVDVEAADLLISSEAVATARTDRTKAVIGVHLYGNLVAPALADAWRDSGLTVIEDAAQAHLAEREGRRTGSLGRLACFSFYPSKNLGALGDGGMIITEDDDLAAAARSLRDHGYAPDGSHSQVGYCSRLDGMQARFLAAKLGHLKQWNANRQALAARYAERLVGSPAQLVNWSPGAVHHLLVVRVPAAQRQRIRNELSAKGIGTGIHYPFALSQQPALEAWRRPCPEAERAAGEILSLPMDPLMSEDDVDAVCAALDKTMA